MVYILGMTDKKTAQLCVKIEPDIYEKLKEYAKLERRSAGFIVRDLVAEWVQKKESDGQTKTQKKMANEK